MNCKILKDTQLELADKYLYLFLWQLTSTENPIPITAEDLANLMGISKHRIYRARGHLVKLGALKFTKKYCPETGRPANEIYEIIRE